MSRETKSEEASDPKQPAAARFDFTSKYKFIDHDEELDLPLIYPVALIDLGNKVKVPAPLFSFNGKAENEDPYDGFRAGQMEVGDYLLVSPVKSGQHWMWEMMHMLLAGQASYRHDHKEYHWLDDRSLNEIKAAEPAPRVLCTHLTPNMLPVQFRAANTKIVVMLRNIKDMLVSHYNHIILFKKDVTWDRYFRLAMYSTLIPFGNYFDVMADIWDSCRTDPNILIVWFEDLKRDPVHQIELVANHMGVSHSPQFIQQVAEAISFANMAPKKMETEKHSNSVTSSGTFYRKGDVGDWKNYFSESQNHEFHKKFDEWNKERQIPMRFE